MKVRDMLDLLLIWDNEGYSDAKIVGQLYGEEFDLVFLKNDPKGSGKLVFILYEVEE